MLENNVEFRNMLIYLSCDNKIIKFPPEGNCQFLAQKASLFSLTT